MKALTYFPLQLSAKTKEVGCYYYFMPQKSPALTLRLGHSGGASCSGNALKGALSARTIVHLGCVQFSDMRPKQKRRVVISALFSVVRQEKHLACCSRSKVRATVMDGIL